ncbi:nicotinate-nucleotide--dimethylbenzimidazole phosphoribosyltransferase [Synechococcus sp. CCY 0621]|uniref:nicotinate-nucleotide--dimethylbenzimidazole phosphoribosyltransferase n=1 Tax=Synechococcus sp. CCY 0621 TaxID=2815603 RepID=UPI001C239EE4|nr:nicotinate-nucleotide--dimethylbenzimidazole phosphoribosyltransferase [Synechococcus sp. CCY 0621]
MSQLRRICGSAVAADRWCGPWRQGWCHSEVLVLLAATDTAAVPGISAAGATPSSRLRTAAADAELLVLGPAGERPHALPPLPAGVSPALISHVVLRELALDPQVADLGCPVAPSVAHLRLPGLAGGGPARCLSGGQALDPGRLEALLALGRRWGERLSPGRPLLLAECVPGGTSTALAVLVGLGVAAHGLVSGSLRHPDHGRKGALVERGLRAAGLEGAVAGDGAAGARVAAALGDPMQPLAAAMVLAAAADGRPVLLAGGSQMAAVLALALALAPPSLRPAIAAGTALGTTAWVADEAGSDLALLLRRIGERWGVEPLAFAADLRFTDPCHPALAAYERGYVKEGVGAGGLALLWQLSGRSSPALAHLCDQACATLLGPPPTVR